MKPKKRLYRSSKDRYITGLCGGLGKFLGIDSTIIRIIMFFSGIGIVPYIILSIIVPCEPVYQSYDNDISNDLDDDFS